MKTKNTVIAPRPTQCPLAGLAGHIGRVLHRFPVLILLFCSSAHAATWYVWTNSPADGPGTTWTNAFHDIQPAVNAATAGDTVLVTNGIYVLSSQVSLTKGIVLTSVHGPQTTVLDGQMTTRCLYQNHASSVVHGFTITRGRASGGGVDLRAGILSGCTVSNNATTWDGGGVLCRGGVVSNCAIVCNSAVEWGVASGAGISCKSAGYVVDCYIAYNTNTRNVGGGVELENSAEMVNCVLAGNVAADGGGGVVLLGHTPVMRNCTIVSNVSAREGGGVFGRPNEGNIFWNCIVAGNTCGDMYTNVYGAIPSYSCVPGWSNGGNVSADPNLTTDFRPTLQSPCVDAASAPQAPNSDLDGIPRPLDGNGDGVAVPDMGAYEFVHPWADTDRDGMPDRDELVADTSPIDSVSCLQFTQLTSAGGSARVCWKGGTVVTQYLERCASRASTGSIEWQAIYTNLPPTPNPSDFVDRASTNCTLFYRLTIRR